jgi:16S rRNA (adenine(1408)-N(1))-methyltransferase
VRRVAAANPNWGAIGVDATIGDDLRATARRAARKPARGGLPNARFGRLALKDAPGELVGIADRLSVILPWGGLLRAVARGEAQALAALRGLCRPGAALRIVFGYDTGTPTATDGGARATAGAGADARIVRELGLPPLDDASLTALEGACAEAGWRVRARRVGVEVVRALGTTWAGRVGWGRRGREFVEVVGLG